MSPAWTDRILWMDSNNLVQLIYYGRSELKTSDHRPVFAIFELNSLKFELPKAEPLLKDTIICFRPIFSYILRRFGRFNLDLDPNEGNAGKM
ncbi:hypothetical protein niasHT_029279 [Heterodera trifolii]|uniref:Inositol polyphosphate-related phosphatase domain-containing protein n=1 Tax=Heterodera trifolii TaxID=157864 RepID=A0ABD2KDC5_9BILA